MRFDVKKEQKGGGCYSLMPPEKLAFLDALNRKLTSWNGYYDYCSLKRKENGRVPNINARIIIDKKSGSINAILMGKGKNEKGMVYFSEIETAFNDIIQFISVCMDHGFLIADKPEEDTDNE